ncbi:MAG: S46 family peptidase, partial [Planctomycetota bacterium]|nr:S46 family peptidase [Planctomycetota bacterium]
SASFVSPKGLIMTNHHCVRGNINEVQGDNDWIKDGFYATTLGDEVKVPGLTVQQLISTLVVTDKVNAGIEEGDDDATINSKRQKNQEEILAAARKERPELTPQIITMHQGAAFQVYSYRIYRDVRLVCSPHLQTSHFGGDPDNFTYPRFGIDFAFCRAYVDGKPADTSEHYFRWSKGGPKKGELAFVTGNPGSTGRLLTKGQMSYLREAQYPIRLGQFDDELKIVKARAATDAAYAKRTRTFVLGRENAQKAFTGYLAGLHNPNIIAKKDKAEAEFRGKVTEDSALSKKFGGAWAELKKINQQKIKLQPKVSFYSPSYSGVLTRAAALVAATAPGAPESARQAVKAPVSQTETAQKLFAAHLKRARTWLGKEDPYVKLLLGDKTPSEAVAALGKSVVTDDKKIADLVAGGRQALENSDDAAIKAALFFTKAGAEANAKMRNLSVKERVQGSLVGQALFSVYGNKVSPDATFSLRLSDGLVKGYRYNGTIAPYRTTFYGLYARNAEFDNKYPFNLPQIWLDRKDKIDMTKGVNFVATNDIIGGNSGSPMVNKDLEVIGLIFDGNIEMLGNRFVYTDEVPRSVSVHSDAIIEAMDKIYDAHRIVKEITQAR